MEKSYSVSLWIYQSGPYYEGDVCITTRFTDGSKEAHRFPLKLQYMDTQQDVEEWAKDAVVQAIEQL